MISVFCRSKDVNWFNFYVFFFFFHIKCFISSKINWDNNFEIIVYENVKIWKSWIFFMEESSIVSALRSSILNLKCAHWQNSWRYFTCQKFQVDRKQKTHLNNNLFSTLLRLIHSLLLKTVSRSYLEQITWRIWIPFSSSSNPQHSSHSHSNHIKDRPRLHFIEHDVEKYGIVPD